MGRTRAFDVDRARTLAMRLFWRRGYSATSVGDLVEATEVARSGLYGVFESKWGLFVESLEDYRLRVVAGLTEPLRDGEGRATERFLRQFIPGPDAEAVSCLLVNALVEFGDDEEEVRRASDAHLEGIETGLRQSLADDGHEPKAARELAAVATCLVVGAFVLRRSARGRRISGPAIRAALKILKR